MIRTAPFGWEMGYLHTVPREPRPLFTPTSGLQSVASTLGATLGPWVPNLHREKCSQSLSISNLWSLVKMLSPECSWFPFISEDHPLENDDWFSRLLGLPGGDLPLLFLKRRTQLPKSPRRHTGRPLQGETGHFCSSNVSSARKEFPPVREWELTGPGTGSPRQGEAGPSFSFN